MAFGKPVIVGEGDGTEADLISDGHNRFLMKSERELPGKLRQARRNPCLFNGAKQHCQDIVRRYDLNNMVNVFEQAIIHSDINRFEPDKENMKEYFEGKKLYGDDFNLNEITQWFQEEKEGYANLGAKEKDRYIYQYHGLNKQYAYQYLPSRSNLRILGYGSAWGEELKPIIKQAQTVTIVEPSDSFYTKSNCLVFPSIMLNRTSQAQWNLTIILLI